MSCSAKRNVYLDVIKGLGIFLVVFAHVSEFTELTQLIFSFHMPLFFIIAGYTYGKYNKDISCCSFIKKKMRSLLVPYFVIGGGLWLYWTLIERSIRNRFDIAPASVLLNMIIGQGTESGYIQDVVLWFLINLFVIQCIFHILYIKSRKLLPFIIILYALLSYIYSIFLKISDNYVRLPWTLDIAGISLLLYSIGFFAYQKNIRIKMTRIKAVTVFAILFITTVAASYANGTVNMLGNTYNNLALFLISSLCGTGCCLSVGYMIMLSRSLSEIFGYMGINSLMIMCLHEPIKRIVIKIFDYLLGIPFGFNVRYIIPTAFIITCVTIILCIPIITVINRYFPMIIGKSNKSRSK